MSVTPACLQELSQRHLVHVCEIFDHLALTFWHDLPAEQTFLGVVSVLWYLLSGLWNLLPGAVLSLTAFISGLKTHRFHLAHNHCRYTEVTLPVLTLPLKWQLYSSIEMCKPSFLYVCWIIVECCSYENPDYGYYSTRQEDCPMLSSSADNHSPAGDSHVVSTPASSLHSSLITSGDDQSTLLGRRPSQGFR